MKNYLAQSFWLSFWVTLLMIGLSFLPDGLGAGGFSLRKMDIFSDIRIAPPDSAETQAAIDSVLLSPDTSTTKTADSAGIVLGPLPPVDSALFGRIIEDYTPGQAGLDTFFMHVEDIARGRTVRVAFFGDSFIEGDILLGDLRDTLQTRWGGSGVGFVPITSEVARFKRTLVHDYKGWNIFSIVKKTDSHPPYGINGFAYQPFDGASVKYQGASWFKHTRGWSSARIFYTTDTTNTYYLKVNGAPAELRALNAPKGLLGAVEVKASWMNALDISLPNPRDLVLYGAALESGPGIYLDNFSVRGNSGGRLKLISVPFMKAFDKYQQYDLIVVQFGLNAATNSLRNIAWYRQELDQTFAHLRACFPGKPILILGIPDRASRVNGELVTMPSVPVIVGMQRDLARKHGFLFYDLYRGMGGPGTMIRFADQRPMLANKDYTHLTHEGGRVVAYMLTDILLQEQKKYRDKKAATSGSGQPL